MLLLRIAGIALAELVEKELCQRQASLRRKNLSLDSFLGW